MPNLRSTDAVGALRETNSVESDNSQGIGLEMLGRIPALLLHSLVEKLCSRIRSVFPDGVDPKEIVQQFTMISRSADELFRQTGDALTRMMRREEPSFAFQKANELYSTQPCKYTAGPSPVSPRA